MPVKRSEQRTPRPLDDGGGGAENEVAMPQAVRAMLLRERKIPNNPQARALLAMPPPKRSGAGGGVDLAGDPENLATLARTNRPRDDRISLLTATLVSAHEDHW